MRYIFNERQMRTLSVLLAGMIGLLAEACTEPQVDMDALCGGWKAPSGNRIFAYSRTGTVTSSRCMRRRDSREG